MFKKAISWVLLFALLCSCLIIPAVAEEPKSDAEAVEQGYQFKVVTKEGTTSYGKFGTVSGNGSRDTTLDSTGNIVPVGSTVTLLTDVTIEKEIYIRNEFTLDGNGKTLNAAFRAADSSGINADVKMKNLKICYTMNASTKQYFMQINANHKVTFEDCTIELDGIPAYGIIIARGDICFDNCTINFNPSDKTKNLYGFRMDTAGANVTLKDTTLNVGTDNKFYAIGLWVNSTLTLSGKTKVIAPKGLGVTFWATDGMVVNVDSTLTKNDVELIWVGEKKGTFNITNHAGDVTNQDVTLCLPVNATEENSGIRFETRLNKEWIDTLVAGGATITTGTILAPKSLVDVENFTLDSLKGFGLKIENDGWNNTATAETDGYYCYFANMVDLSDKSLTNEIVGVGYITITIDGIGTVTYYGTVQSGIVRDIASGMTGTNDAQNAVLQFFRGSAT